MSYRNRKPPHHNRSNSVQLQQHPHNKNPKQEPRHRIHFLNALSTIPIPPSLQKTLLRDQGVPVVQVAANGKTQAARLTLSPDKFTLTLTATTASTATTGGGLFSFGPKTPLFETHRAIDIGEMDRIQIGQSTQQFEMAKKHVDKQQVKQQQQQQPMMMMSMMPKAELFRNASTSTEKASNIVTGSGKTTATATAAISSASPPQRSISLGSGSGSHHNSATAAAAAGGGGTASSSSSSSNSSVASLSQWLDPDRSFSIIFRGAQTLDLMVVQENTNNSSGRNNNNNNLRNELCTTLTNILQAYQMARIRVAPEVLLLRYIWLSVIVVVAPPTMHENTTTTATTIKKSLLRRSQSAGSAPSATTAATTIAPPCAGYANVQHWTKILAAMNFVLKPKEMTAAYEHFGKVIGLDRTQRRRGLTFEQSATFLHKIKRDSWMVKPVSVIWNELFGQVMNNGKQRTTVSEKTFLEKFLHGCQGEMGSTLTTVRLLFRKLHDMEIAHETASSVAAMDGRGGGGGRRHRDLSRITKDQFEAYLFGAGNDAFDPAKDQLDMSDMNQPLSEYWINSSHNTYLIGDQYTSHSSVEMYSNALYRGARCLELDIWDGGKTAYRGTPIPVVWHGHTMTTKILFEEIIKTIKVFLNFHPDSFPIVLSFENHCSIPYQEVMADQLVRILGDSLYIPKEASLFGPLPSPAQLRGMVVIKGRRPDGTEADGYDTDDDCYYDLSDDEDGAGGPTSSMGDLTVQMELQAQRATLRKKHKVAPQLARLTLFHGHKLQSFDESIRSPTYFMHSFSENKVRSNCRHKLGDRWIVHNQTHMSRTYPAGSRLDSSNYNPLLAWSMGCQMVALNFQTQDAFLRLNDGRFRENGNWGYVLKPSSLMIKDDYSQTSSPVKLSVRVLSGSCLPKPKGQRTGDCIDPYVKVAVFDVANQEKETMTSYQTDPVSQNGFFPIWVQAKFQFRVENWSVAMLQLTLYDKTKDEFIASSSIPISCLRKGIRSCKLYDSTNTRTGAFDFASLLLDIKISQVVAEI